MTTFAQFSLLAFKRIGMYSEDRPLDEMRLQEAISVFNDLIRWVRNSSWFIPFSKTDTFNLVASQRSYDLGDALISPINIENLQLKDGDTVYPCMKLDADSYYSTYRNDLAEGRPVNYFTEENTDHTTLIFYIIPDKDYECTIFGRFGLPLISYGTDSMDFLSDRAYLFFEYALARELATMYPSQSWDGGKETRYQQYLRDYKNANKVDLSAKTYAGPKARNNYCYDLRGRH